MEVYEGCETLQTYQRGLKSLDSPREPGMLPWKSRRCSLGDPGMLPQGTQGCAPGS